MTTALAPMNGADIIERVVMAGDLGKLSAQDRVAYYRRVCESVGLNPLTRPFDYITLQGKLTLYARKDATDQMRRIHRVSIQIAERERIEDVYVVTARATTPDGRIDESTGAVTIANLKGDALANALMKAETKAKRRVTLSICGMGWLDETELSTIADAQPIRVDQTTGEIFDAPPPDPPNGNSERAVITSKYRQTVTEAREKGCVVAPVTLRDMSNEDIVAATESLQRLMDAKVGAIPVGEAAS